MPAILWSAFIFFLCFLPGSALPKEDWLDKIYVDKIVHAGLYFVLFLFIIRIFTQKTTKAVFIAGTLCIIQGVLIEFVQGSSLIQNRSFDVWDIAANVMGVIAGVIFIIKGNNYSM